MQIIFKFKLVFKSSVFLKLTSEEPHMKAIFENLFSRMPCNVYAFTGTSYFLALNKSWAISDSHFINMTMSYKLFDHTCINFKKMYENHTLLDAVTWVHWVLSNGPVKNLTSDGPQKYAHIYLQVGHI